MCCGGQGPSDRLGKPSSRHVARSHFSPAPGAGCPSDPHLGLELRQPGLALQEVGLELGSAPLKLSRCRQELLLVLGAGQQAPGQELWEQGLEEKGRDVPCQVGDRDSAELTHLWPSLTGPPRPCV